MFEHRKLSGKVPRCARDDECSNHDLPRTGYRDFVFLAGSTTWLQSQEELNQLLPPYSERQRQRAYWIRKAI